MNTWIKMLLLTLSLVALPPQARAETITFSENANFTPTGDFSLAESGIFEIPRFDPSLGTLNSASYQFELWGSTDFDILFRPGISTFTYDVNHVMYSFLGKSYSATNSTSGWGYFGDPYNSRDIACGADETYAVPTIGDFPNPCPDAHIPFSRGSNMWHTSTITDAINDYIGLDPMILPWSTTIEVMSPENYNAPSIVFGDHLTKGSFSAHYSYNYTPVTVTVTPEPRLAGLLLITLIVGGVLKSRKLCVNN